MPRKPKAVVTGGAGFIGSNLVSHLRGESWEVSIVDDLSSGSLANLDDGLLPEPRSVTEPAAGEDYSGASTIFHLAASVGNQRSISDPIRDAEVNLIGTLRVLEAARDHNIGTIVTSSSAGIFGQLQQLPIREDHPLDPDSPYGATKLASEKMALVYAGLYDLDVVALRYFNVYGPNQRYDEYGNVIPVFVFPMLAGRTITIFGDGEQTRDFLNVSDVVDANIAAAATSGLSGAFNLGSGSQVTINELARILHEIIGVKWNVRYGPPRPADVRHSVASTKSAQEAFGFEARVDLYSGLEEYVKWAETVMDE